MDEKKLSDHNNDKKIRKCSNDFQSKLRELDKAVGDLLEVGRSNWVDYKDILETSGAIKWSIDRIKERIDYLEGKIEIAEFRSTGTLQ